MAPALSPITAATWSDDRAATDLGFTAGPSTSTFWPPPGRLGLLPRRRPDLYDALTRQGRPEPRRCPNWRPTPDPAPLAGPRREPYEALTRRPGGDVWLGGVLDRHESADHIDRNGRSLRPPRPRPLGDRRKSDGVFLGYAGIQAIWPGCR